MSEGPSNAVLAAKLDSMKELMEVKFAANEKAHEKANNHLSMLNGQVIKNTKFRWQAAIYGSMAIIVVPLLIKEILERIS